MWFAWKTLKPVITLDPMPNVARRFCTHPQVPVRVPPQSCGAQRNQSDDVGKPGHRLGAESRPSWGEAHTTRIIGRLPQVPYDSRLIPPLLLRPPFTKLTTYQVVTTRPQPKNPTHPLEHNWSIHTTTYHVTHAVFCVRKHWRYYMYVGQRCVLFQHSTCFITYVSDSSSFTL